NNPVADQAYGNGNNPVAEKAYGNGNNPVADQAYGNNREFDKMHAGTSSGYSDPMHPHYHTHHHGHVSTLAAATNPSKENFKTNSFFLKNDSISELVECFSI